MLDKQKNRGTLQPYLRNVNVRWFSFDLSDLKEMRFEEREGSRFDLQYGDLVICEGGEPGRAAVWKGQTHNAKIQKALHRVRFRTGEYEPIFAMYYLFYSTITNQLASHYTGTTIKHLTGAALSQVAFPIPPINEQRRIVTKIEELFSNLDAGVAALERAKAKLKRYRASVLKAAVEGKLTEEWRAKNPGVEPASKLLERILIERRQKWESDQLAKFAANGKEPPKNWKAKYVEPTPPATEGLPELPEGWCWANLEQITSETRPICYGILMPKENVEDGVLYVKVKDMKGDTIDLSGLHRTLPEIAAEYKRASLITGDWLLSIRGTYGRVAKVPAELNGGNITQDTARVAFSELIRGDFAASSLRSALGQNYFKKVARGVAVKGVNIADVKNCPVPLCPVREQDEINMLISELFSQINFAETSTSAGLAKAKRLRQSILKQAFEGKLVPQDPADEPASVLLERMRPSRSVDQGNETPATPARTRGRRTKSEQSEGAADE